MDELRGQRGRVLGMAVDVVDYGEAVRRVDAWAQAGGVRLVAAANTHLAAEAATQPVFAEVMRGFDLVAPDGMPLVWCLWLDGWEIRERVYGPYLMAHCLRKMGGERRHAFVGGTEECLTRLEAAVREMRPGIQIAGVVSPPFGQRGEAADVAVVEAIRALKADVVWLALGGVRQETWLAQNRHRLPDGVYLAVGDAFALLAGMRAYAPAWMQRLGLTWLFRLLQEPGRLASRYATYNARFLRAFLAERWQRAHGRPAIAKAEKGGEGP